VYVLVSLFGFLEFVFCSLRLVSYFFSSVSFGFPLVFFLFNSFFLFPLWCLSDFVLFFFSFVFCLDLGFFCLTWDLVGRWF